MLVRYSSLYFELIHSSHLSLLYNAQRKFDAQEFQVKEILSEVFQHATNIDNEYEIEGKSIDE